MSEIDVEIKMDGLKSLEKILKENKLSVRIGVLGAGVSRKGEKTNAEIGAAHEYGTTKLPMRSFLRMPLTMQLSKQLEQASLKQSNVVVQCLKARSLMPLLTKVGIMGEAVVQEAFDTSGFGQWKPSDMRFKKVHQTLVETQQLRRSISSEVKA